MFNNNESIDQKLTNINDRITYLFRTLNLVSQEVEWISIYNNQANAELDITESRKNLINLYSKLLPEIIPDKPMTKPQTP